MLIKIDTCTIKLELNKRELETIEFHILHVLYVQFFIKVIDFIWYDKDFRIFRSKHLKIFVKNLTWFDNLKIFFTKLGLTLSGFLKISAHKQAHSRRGEMGWQGEGLWGGGGGGGGGEDSPLPSRNKFILPTAWNTSFWCYALNCQPEEFFALSCFYVERGYHITTSDFIK